MTIRRYLILVTLLSVLFAARPHTEFAVEKSNFLETFYTHVKFDDQEVLVFIWSDYEMKLWLFERVVMQR